MHQPDHDIRNRLLIARLPAMPQILIRLIEHLQADDLGLPELAALIAKDAGMTAKMLAVANSSAYHRSGRAGALRYLEHALAALGTDMIKTLVIGESVLQTFNSFPHSGSTDLRGFWKKSLLAAVIARDLAARIDYPQPEEAYLAGLLHNVGRLALLATAPREYAFNFTARDDADLCAVEQRTMQITHPEAGAWLIERWHLDSFLADAVLYHHEPSSRLQAAHPLIRIVRLAHLLSCHAPDDGLIGEALALCQVDEDEVDAILAQAQRQVEESAGHLGIDLAGADDIAAPAAYAPAAASDPVQLRLAEEVRNLVLVAEVGQSFARQQGESGLLEAMTRSARILFDFDSVVILLENPGGHALVGMPNPDQQRLAQFSIALTAAPGSARGAGLVASAALERRLAFIERDAQALGLAEEQLFRLLGTDALVCVPLVAGARSLGVLVGGLAAWQLALCQQRERFMRSFGAQAAGALQAALAQRGTASAQLEQAADQHREASRRVIHEVNNPLSIIKNYLSILDSKLARHEPVAGEISILNEEIDRVGQLISGLAQQPDARLAPVLAAPGSTGNAGNSVARIADDVVRLFQATGFLPASIEISLDLPAEATAFEGDAGILRQILVNLVKNAVEALGGGGRIAISSRGHVNRERRLYLELAISDDGPGMPADVLATLFSPVRSSKRASEGADRGLGLAIVYSLVQKLDGLITCRSGSGGTTFEILLPARGAADSISGVRPKAMDSARGSHE